MEPYVVCTVAIAIVVVVVVVLAREPLPGLRDLAQLVQASAELTRQIMGGSASWQLPDDPREDTRDPSQEVCRSGSVPALGVGDQAEEDR